LKIPSVHPWYVFVEALLLGFFLAADYKFLRGVFGFNALI